MGAGLTTCAPPGKFHLRYIWALILKEITLALIEMFLFLTDNMAYSMAGWLLLKNLQLTCLFFFFSLS